MSEWRVQVVQLGKVGKHPNADTLSITQVGGKYPVIFKSSEFSQGHLAVHIPPDSLVDTRLPAFSWLADKAANNGLYRVKFQKLRGIPSYGFLVPIEFLPECADGYQPGQTVHTELGVTKYDPDPAYQQGNQVSGDIVRCPVEAMVPFYDIEGLRKFESLIGPDERVWVSEKIHGSNGRWIYVDGQLFSGSRTKFRQESVWNRMAEKYRLSEILGKPENQGLVLYGEVYGPGIQDLTYGLSEPEVRFFDIYDTNRGTYWRPARFIDWCIENNLPVVPTLAFDVAFMDIDPYPLAEGETTLPSAPSGHVREGVVIKPMVERWDQQIGRVFLKLPGEGYLLRKQPVQEPSVQSPSV